MRHVPGVHRRAPHRIEQRAAVAAGDRAEGHRRVGRAEGRDADLRDALAGRRGDDAERVDVAGLALVGAHAGRGVALDVLDRAIALAQRKADVGGGDVVLQVDERLALCRAPARAAAPAARPASSIAGSSGGSAAKPAAAAASTPARAPSRRQAASVKAPLQAPAERSAWTGSSGQEERALVVVARARARLRLQMDGRVPAAGHRHDDRRGCARPRPFQPAIAQRTDLHLTDRAMPLRSRRSRGPPARGCLRPWRARARRPKTSGRVSTTVTPAPAACRSSAVA